MSRAETMKLVKDLRKQGFAVDRTGTGHWKVSRPGWPGFVVLGFSPGSKGMHKTLKRLRELGYKTGGE